MTNPGDHISDEFSPSDLLEPTKETLATFEALTDELKALRGLEHTSFIHPNIHDPQSGWEVGIDLRSVQPYRGEHPRPRERGLDLKAWSKERSPWHPEVDIDSGPKDPEAVQTLERVIPGIQSHLREKGDDRSITKAAWLELVLDAVRVNAEATGYPDETIDDLFEDSPFEVHRIEVYDLQQTFENGTTLWGSISPSSEQDGKDGKQKIDLRTIEGVRYDFDASPNRPSTLIIERPAHRVVHEIDDSENTLPPVDILGAREMKSQLAAARAAERASQERITNGKLQELNKALRKALDSGVVSIEENT